MSFDLLWFHVHNRGFRIIIGEVSYMGWDYSLLNWGVGCYSKSDFDVLFIIGIIRRLRYWRQGDCLY